MDNKKRSPIDRLLFATFLKGRTSSCDVWEEKGDMTPEDNQKIIEETNEIINDDSSYPFISYLSDLLVKSKPSDDDVKKLHDCIEKVAVALGALPQALAKPIIDTIKKGSVLFIYANNKDYLANSTFLSPRQTEYLSWAQPAN